MIRKIVVAAGLVAVLLSPTPAPAGATEVDVPQEQECKEVRLPVDGGLAVSVEKKIRLAGAVLDLDVDQEVVRVAKTVAVQVCVWGEDGLEVKAHADADLNGVAECRDGALGAAIHLPVTVDAGTDGGALNVRVQVAVSDRDVLLGEEFNNLDVVINEHKRVVVPEATVEDRDAVDADLCVGPVGIR